MKEFLAIIFVTVLLFVSCSENTNNPEDGEDKSDETVKKELFFYPDSSWTLAKGNNTLEIKVKDSTEAFWASSFKDTSSRELRNTYELRVKELTGDFPEYHFFGVVQDGRELTFGAMRHPLFESNYFVDYFIEYFKISYDQKDTVILRNFTGNNESSLDSIVVSNIVYELNGEAVNAIKI